MSFLRNLIDKAKPKPGLRALTAQLNDGDGTVRNAAAQELGKLKDARAVEPLLAALHHSDFVTRMVAAEALGRLGDARATEPLMAALHDDEGLVRGTAATALGYLKDARAVEPLLAALHDSDEFVCSCAARALGELKDARAAGPLLAALKDGEEGLRDAAAFSLGLVGDERAVEPLIALLEHGAGQIRETAALALGQLGDARAIAPLRAALNDPDSNLALEASESLRVMNVPEAEEGVVPVEEPQPAPPPRPAAPGEALGVRFDIRKVAGGGYDEGGYGAGCWRIFWRTVDSQLVAGAALVEGDTDATPDRENVYCLGFRWLAGEGRAADVRAALSQSAQFQAVAAEPPFIDAVQLAREPLISAGRVDSAGQVAGPSLRALPAWQAVRQEQASAVSADRHGARPMKDSA